MRTHRLSRSLMILAACGGLLLPGCSTQSQRLGADDGSDVCRPQRVTLDSTGDFFGEDIVKGAAIGAVGGGLVGLLAGGNARSAAIGAVAGGVAGAAGGYFAARQQQSSDQASLYRTVSSDIDRDNAVIDKTQIAFNQLVDCRRGEANRIRADLRAGRITRPQAEAAMAAVRQRSQVDVQMAQAINGRIEQRGNDFALANQQVNPGASSAGRASSRARPPSTPAGQVQVATSTNLAKRDQLNQSIQRAASNTSAFELS